MFGCFNRWVVTLVAGDGGVERFDLVIEVNCISNMSLNYTLQLTTLRTPVSESLQLHFKNTMLLWWFFAVVEWLPYLQNYCMLFDMYRWDFFQRCMISADLGGFLSGCLMHLATHNHLLLSLPATTVTILWLKQPICFCSACMHAGLIWRSFQVYQKNMELHM